MIVCEVKVKVMKRGGRGKKDVDQETIPQLTAPLGDQRIDVHEQCEQLMRLTEAWLVAIEGDHDGALQRTMTEATITTLHQRIMDSRIEDGSIDFTSFLDIHEAIVLGTLVRLL